ncbi:MAG: hypothetical protein JNN10_00795 [Sphingopyxis sp.]|uniref:hypothetical protein n=1 Tax=Sphingopyxis sp. TaxID=1908224 RepID=UPI001A36D1BD|nr:hypothetical protein [Sphingopyxis sp.]MBL9064810.1 hypothetical protein [Sphingopyxis sp.]
MLDIAAPRLTPAEWRDVRSALQAVANCGCATLRDKGSLSWRARQAIASLVGSAQHSGTPVEFRPVLAFLCETSRQGRISEDHVPALEAKGFSRSQIEALALLGS